ncbi:hypothetical protein [Hymenobacter canadensis]|uniref:Uncharacterized protein n=1 Tax=Hymenobacter canadensis TaxID=2999067 RepID=A0ABY7LPM7_9BACT|nr:hypothetical protein [Hymenobacter canadensis]WBA42381.1 hypothetical protein O3303_02215 [Hymenobacter canadensis]
MPIHFRTAVYGLITAGLMAAQAGWAQTKAPGALPKQASILDGRAYLRFPASAVSSARPVDIMSAKPDEQLETRVVMDFGEHRVVFFARELFRLADKQFVSQAAAFEAGRFPATTQVIGNTDSLTAVVSTATRHDTAASAILLKRLLVRTIDNTVLVVDAYVNPKGFPRKARYEALADSVFRTVRPGKRLLSRKAHTETQDRLVFQLPENYVLSRKQSYDFFVYSIRPMTPLLAESTSGITVYLGNHPSPVYRDEGVPASTAQPLDGNFLGKKIQWMGFSKPTDQLYWREQIIPAALGKSGPLAHVFVHSASPDGLNELTAIVEAITVKK